jgi:hypothetical protein
MLPVHIPDINQFEPGFMNKRCSLDCSACLFIPHEAPCNAAKLFVHAWRQFTKRALVAFGPGT